MRIITAEDFKKAETAEGKRDLLTLLATKKAVWKETVQLEEVQEPNPFDKDLGEF